VFIEFSGLPELGLGKIRRRWQVKGNYNVYLFLLSDYDDDDGDDDDYSDDDDNNISNNNQFPYLNADGTALGPNTKPLIHN
jgi:hypothetical protein